MIIDVDIYEKIRIMYTVENKSQRAIARDLGISRNTVKKYCKGDSVPWERKEYSREANVMTPEVIDFISECFAEDQREKVKKQQHTAKRIFDRLVEEKNFTGGESTVRLEVSKLKDKTNQAYVPLAFEPGEAVQIDWGEATVYFNNEKTKVNLFCMRLCNSLDIYVRAFLRQNEESFLEGHVKAFEHFQGVPKKLIFDNAKVAVKEGFGTYAKPQDRYKALGAHYCFKMEFCNPGKGNEKGLVENLVGWFRRNVLVPIPRVKDIDELNDILTANCFKYRAHQVKGRQMTVGQMYEVEKHSLINLPKYIFDSSKLLSCKVDEFSTVRFEKNNYSVPVKLVGKDVTVKGYGNIVKIYYQGQELTTHPRNYGLGKTAYKLEHYIDLLEKKPRSVFNAKPVKETVAKELIEWGSNFEGGAKDVVKLLRLSIDHGLETLLEIKNTMPQGIKPNIDLVRSYLIPKTEKIERIQTPKDIPVQVVDLKIYDKQYGVAQ